MNLLFLLFAICFLPQSMRADQGQPHYRIWFDSPTSSLVGDFRPYGSNNPDEEWESRSLPIGNGSIGANILGSVSQERITFNEKSLWRGGPNTSQGAAAYWNMNKQSSSVLPEIREAFMKGDDRKAAELTQDHFNGLLPYDASLDKPFRFGNYTTMGAFNISTGIPESNIRHYKRVLSLDSALVNVSFEQKGSHYHRSYFISYPSNVMVVRFRTDNPHKQTLSFQYHPNPDATGCISRVGKDELLYRGRLKNNQMEFVVRIKAASNGGSISIHENALVVSGSNDVVFYITADTDYRMNFDPDVSNPMTYVGVDPLKTTEKWLLGAVRKGYRKLLAEHYGDYSRLFGKVRIRLGDAPVGDTIPTHKRLAAYREGSVDPYLEELYYQYGRYLLIASSRAGNLPANLQGMWHNAVDGPWRVDYHNNINIQMNYWPALSANLDECVLPLMDFIRTLEQPGRKTAKDYFAARGWTASISSNIFGFTAPLVDKDMSWNFNPMAGPWLATHVWDYYDYTRNKKFLKEIGYPLIKSSAEFTSDFLWKKPDGTYTAAPSTSPEHGPVDQGATFVHAVAREILLDAIEASKVLGRDVQERKQWEEIIKKLAPYKIGRYGQLMEWSSDIDDPNDHHRHVNHLFGLHPGHTISPITTPRLSQAAKVVLEHRGDGATGWSMGWKLNQWARLQDGNHAYVLYRNLLKNGTLDNLWDSHPPFQIDGNFGGTAGVTEMLLQSHMGFIQLLPALPDDWADGQVSGICARGNFEVSMNWKKGMLQECRILSKSGGLCKLRYKNDVLEFNTKKGETYTVVYLPSAGLQRK